MSEPRVGVFRERGASGWTWQCSGVRVGVVGRMNTAINNVGPFAACDRPDCPICATRNALQTTHNESREGC